MSGKKGRSGRLPRAIELARSRGKDDALSCVRRRLPQLLQVLVEKAEAGDKECAVYLVDRVLGRPRLELDQRLTSSVDVTLDPSRLLAAMREREQIEAQYRLVSEREPSDPTRESSHAPVSAVDITASFEHDVAKERFCDVSVEGTQPTETAGPVEIPPAAVDSRVFAAGHTDKAQGYLRTLHFRHDGY